MLETVKNTIAENNMLTKNDKVLVALSGGCDSISLCLVLMELGYDIGVAHMNHSIRDTASRDETFVTDFATRYNINYHIKKVDVPSLAKKMKVSLETAGRRARYDFFEEVCKEYGYTKIAIAHNLNDNCETFIMNLSRGSGIKGLSGIPKVRGKIIRPLLEVSRAQLEDYVHIKEEEFVEDETNFMADCTRNKIRLEVVPALIKLNPNFMKNLSRTINILNEDSKFITKSAEKIVEIKKDSSIIDKESFILMEESLKRESLKIAYKNAAGTTKDFEKRHIDYIISIVKDKEHGKIIDLCFGVSCSMKYGKIVFEKKSHPSDYEYLLPICGEVEVKEANIKFKTSIIHKNEIDYSKNNCEYFDYDKISGKIKIRNRRNGDRITPFGFRFAKKVKDILIDNKVEASQRSLIPIFATDDIMWVYGVKRSDKYKVDKDSVNILKIQGEDIKYDK